MNTPATNVAGKKNGQRAPRKPPSAKRVAAETAFKSAKSDQEKTVARAQLKSIRFEDLARARVRRISKGLDGLMNLANRAAYAWTDEQAAKILNHISDKFKAVTMKFAGTAQKKEEFDL